MLIYLAESERNRIRPGLVDPGSNVRGNLGKLSHSSKAVALSYRFVDLDGELL